MPQVAENMKAWEGSFKHGTSRLRYCIIWFILIVCLGEWTKASLLQKRIYVEFLIESLEHRDTEIRFLNARRLFYLLQGFLNSSLPLLS